MAYLQTVLISNGWLCRENPDSSSFAEKCLANCGMDGIAHSDEQMAQNKSVEEEASPVTCMMMP